MNQIMLTFIFVYFIVAGTFIAYSFSPTHSYNRNSSIIVKIVWVAGAALAGCATGLLYEQQKQSDLLCWTYAITEMVIVLVISYCIPKLIQERKKGK